MTEDEAFDLIARLQKEMVPLNLEDPWEIMILTWPIEEEDDEGQPTGEFRVHVGWHCWALEHDGRHEYGRLLSVRTPHSETAALYQTMARNYADSMGTVQTFRNEEGAS